MLGPGGTDSPCFCIDQDREEQHRGQTAQLILFSINHGTRLCFEVMEQGGANLCDPNPTLPGDLHREQVAEHVSV